MRCMEAKILAITAFLQVALSSASRAEDYICDNGTRLTAIFTTAENGLGAVELTLLGSNEQIALPQVLSADGGRYAAGVTEFWIRGSQATLRRGSEMTTCKR
jgi:membrane-bound inhibitor of C-type lysozyme